MVIRRILVLLAVAALATPAAFALNPDDEQFIPAAVRGAGLEGSFWVTDLYVMNLGEDEITVEVVWLVRGADNSEAEGVEFDIGGGETLVLEDVILETFGEETAAGAFIVEVVEEEDQGEADAATAAASGEPAILATARILNRSDGGTFGQGFEGVIARAAISSLGNAVTHAIGVSDDADFRTNWYGLNLTEDAEGEPAEAEVTVEVLDLAGDVLAARTFTMPSLAPMLGAVGDLGAGTVHDAVLRFTMVDGMGIFGASKVDGLTNDPTTLAAHWDCDACAGVAGEAVQIATAKLYIEFNATDDDIGVHGTFDDEGWTELCLFDPDGVQVISLRPKGELGELGMAQVFFESREPESDEWSFENLKEAFPEGQYTIVAVTFEGEPLTGAATFTHDVPEMPVITAPAGLVDDPEEAEPPVVGVEDLVVSWQPVTMTVDGDPVTITAYEVIVTKEEHEDPNGLSRPVYDVHLPPDRTSLPVPMEFLEAETLYEVEVLALEVSGNQTIAVGFFATE